MRTLFIPFLLISFSSLNAQDISIQQVLESAQSQNVIQAQKQLTVQEIQTKVQKSKRLPLIYGDANLQRNLVVPVTPVPAIAFDPNAAPGSITYLRFATDWTAKAGLQMSLDVFNPLNHAQIKEARIQQQKAEEDNKTAHLDFKQLLFDLYAQVVLAQEQEKVAEATLKLYNETFQILEERYNAGRLSQIEMNNAWKKIYELEHLAQEANAVAINKRIALLPYIPLNLKEHFSTSIQELAEMNQYEADFSKSTQIGLDMELNQSKLRNLNLQALPKLTLNGYYGTQFFDNDLRLFNAAHWYGSSFVNLTLRLPITETYERSLQRKKLSIEQQILESQYAAARTETSVAEAQANNELLMLSSKIEKYKQILQLLQQNVSIMQAKVKEGTVLISELNVAIEAEQDQQKKVWQAQYDYLQKILS